MRIKIINGTDWPTGEFRNLFRACAKHEGMDHDGTYVVELYYPRGGGGGWGYYNRRHMKIALPNWAGFPEDRERATRKCAHHVATTIIHEMSHNRGLKHRDMSGEAESEAARAVCEKLGMKWLHRDTPAQTAKAAAPAPSKLDVAEAKLARADELIAAEQKRHITNLRRLRTRRRKALASYRYYLNKES